MWSVQRRGGLFTGVEHSIKKSGVHQELRKGGGVGFDERRYQAISAGLAAFTDRVLKLFTMVPELPSPL
jgi:hypothetical protein